MFDPLTLCPSRFPLVRLLSKKSVPLTLHTATPVTLHVSSIGNGVRPGRYVILLGPSIISPTYGVHYSPLSMQAT